MNNQKNELRVNSVETYDDGSTTTTRMYIPRDDDPNSIFNKVVQKFTEEYITAVSDEASRAAEEQRSADKVARELVAQDDLRRHNQEKLFSLKLESFEIEEVKNSTNRQLKSKIRKAKTLTEVQAFTTIIIMEELRNAGILTSDTSSTSESTSTSAETATDGGLDSNTDSDGSPASDTVFIQ